MATINGDTAHFCALSLDTDWRSQCLDRLLMKRRQPGCEKYLSMDDDLELIYLVNHFWLFFFRSVTNQKLLSRGLISDMRIVIQPGLQSILWGQLYFSLKLTLWDNVFYRNCSRDKSFLFIEGIVVCCPACSNWFIIWGVVVVGVLHLHPWVGVKVVAIHWVFVVSSHLCCCPYFCLSLFEDADKDNKEKEEQDWNRNGNCDYDTRWDSCIVVSISACSKK